MRDISAITTYSDANFGSEPINVLKVEWSSGTKYYADKALGTADGSSIANAIGCIESLGQMNMRLDSFNQAQNNSVNVTLIDDDSDSRFLTLFQTESMYKLPCTLYQAYDTDGSGTVSDTIVLLSGEFTAPITWSEANRNLMFTIATPIEDTQIGFSTTYDKMKHASEDIDGKVWPMAFGDVLRVPALRVSGILKGVTQESIEYEDIDQPLEGTTVEVTNGKLFPQNTQLELVIDGNNFNGIFDGDTLTITSAYQAKYTDLIIGVRDENDEGNDHRQYLWITEDDYAAGVRLMGLWCLITSSSGTKYLNYCLQQKGTRCFFKYPWPIIYDENTGLTITASKYGLKDWGWCRTGQSTGFWLLSSWLRAQENWSINSGSEVYIKDQDKNVVYIANALGDGDVVEVMARRKVDDKSVIVAVPSSYFTIDKTYNPGALFNDSESGYPTTCLSVIMNVDLNTLEYEDWESDEIFVSMRCGVNKTIIDLINHLLTTYTNYTPDATSFASANSTLNLFPANFALLTKNNVAQLCRELAYQAGCGLVFTNDTVSIKKLFEEPTITVTLEDSDIDIDSITLGQTDYLDIITSYTANYNLDYESRTGKYLTELNTDVYDYINLDEKFYAYNKRELVVEVADFWIGRLSRPWRTINFTTYLNYLNLETFDYFYINLTDNLLGIGDDSIKCMVRELSHDTQTGKIIIEAWLPSEAGTIIESDYAFTTFTGDNSSPLNGLALTDYTISVKSLSAESSTPYEHSRGEDEDTDEMTVADSTIIQAKIIQALSYDNAVTQTAGKKYYKLRPIESNYEEWVPFITYNKDNHVLEGGVLYVATKTSTGVRPGDTSGWAEFWSIVEEITVQYSIGNRTRMTHDLRNYIPWFEVNEIVPLISIENEYYIFQTLIYTGQPDEASLRYNDDEKRTMAVFA